MKTITHLFTQDIIIRRYKTVSGNRKILAATATVDGMIQNMDKEKAQLLGILSERTFIAYLDIDVNIQLGDNIVDRYGKKYTVKEITKKDYGINTHLECVLTEFNA
jgi:hypothetical protein